MTVLLCGGTGALGGAIAKRLAERPEGFRALVRTESARAPLLDLGADVVVGDLTDPGSLEAAVDGVDVVLTTANAIGRLLAGSRDVSIAGVDDRGNAALIDAAERAGVGRFVFVSIAGLSEDMARRAPFAMAKLRTERRLASSPMRQVIVRPEKYQEVWLSPETGIDPAKRRAVIFGRGRIPEPYVAIDDVAQVCVRLAIVADPPRMLEFGGPEALTRLQVVEEFERAYATTFHRIRVPRALLAVGSKALMRVKPEVASVLGMALHADTHGAVGDARPLEQLGIAARPASAYIAELARGA